jgi:DNA-binding MarR family transcriptional regulator
MTKNKPLRDMDDAVDRSPLDALVARSVEDVAPLGRLVRQAHRAFMRVMEPRLAAYGISTGTWSFMRLLWTEDGMTQSELSRCMKVKEPTTVRAVDRLQTLGYVERRRTDADKRKVRVFLTDKGRGLKRSVLPLAHEVNGIGLSGLTADEVKTMRRLLAIVINSLDEYVAKSADGEDAED